jgi:hypothetical protein
MQLIRSYNLRVSRNPEARRPVLAVTVVGGWFRRSTRYDLRPRALPVTHVCRGWLQSETTYVSR